MALREPPLGIPMTSNASPTTLSWIDWFSELFSIGTTNHPLIQSIDTNNTASSISFSSDITKDTKQYEIKLIDVSMSNGATLQLVASEDTGATLVSSYSGMSHRIKHNSTTNTNTYLSSTVLKLTTGGLNSTVNKECSGSIIINDPGNTSHYKTVQWELKYTDVNGDFTLESGIGKIKTTSAVDWFRIQSSSGNFISGIISLYGLK